MRRLPRLSRAIAATILGICIGIPCRAWSGPDFCTGYFSSSEAVHLTITSRSIDGVLEDLSSDGGATGTLNSLGDNNITAYLPDPVDPVDGGARDLYLRAASR